MSDPDDCVRELARHAGIVLEPRAEYHWPEIERAVGLSLPADYKLLAESFPSGWFRQFVRPDKPQRSSAGAHRLDEFAMDQLETLRSWRAEGYGSFPYPIYPEPGGLLPWGAIREGGYAFWLTQPSADPDSWPVVAASQQCDYWDRYNGSVCRFLIEVTTARYDATGFAEGPIRVVLDESGAHQTGQPINLAERPVFERDSDPPDEMPSPGGTKADS